MGRLLCCGEAGEKEKESARGTMGTPFPSSHRPPRAFYFFFDGDTQRKPLRRRELSSQMLQLEDDMPGTIGQVSFKSYLPSKKI